MQLILYTTSHCHLCEEAMSLLIEIATQYNIDWLSQEIADDNTLLERYGLRIPVIKNNDTENEISWPFTTREIVDLIENSIDSAK